MLYSHYHNVLWEVRKMLKKEKGQKLTKKLPLKTLILKELKQVNGGQPLGLFSDGELL